MLFKGDTKINKIIDINKIFFEINRPPYPIEGKENVSLDI